MNRRAFCLALLLVVTASCSSYGSPQATAPAAATHNTWWRELVAFVPADADGHEIWLTNTESLLAKAGLPPPGRPCDNDGIALLNDYPDGVDGATYFSVASAWVDAGRRLGFDRCQVKSQLRIAYGSQRYSLWLYVPSTSQSMRREALTAAGYTAMENAVYAAPAQPVVDAFAEGILHSLDYVALDDTFVLHSASVDAINASLGASRGEAAPLSETTDGRILASLDPFDSAWIPSGVVPLSVPETVSRIGGANATPEQLATISEHIVAPYLNAGWGRLPPPARFGIAYLRAKTPEDQMKLALTYSNEADASKASDEIALRLRTYDSLYHHKPVCKSATSTTKRIDEMYIVVANCGLTEPSQWMRLVLERDTIFLTETLR